MPRPTLKFKAGDQSGFTPAGLTSFQDIDSAAVVRELIQNSSDAARGYPAEVVFLLERVPTASIPGISKFEQALKGAIASQRKLQPQGQLPDHAQRVVDVMQECLVCSEAEVLAVLDNGVGLDAGRLRSLLGDGISYQDSFEATGALGNGHTVAIPASDLRYVLYGGILSSGHKICSGHSIIASQDQRGTTLSKDGYFVAKFNDDFKKPYVFARGHDVPPLVTKYLELIRERWGCGTAVIILGFNRFHARHTSDDILVETILRSAAASFFCSLNRGGLAVEVRCADQIHRLDKHSVGTVLKKNATQQRSEGPFLSGRKANSAFEALQQSPTIVSTPHGDATVHYTIPEEGATEVHLCRNGMWITDKLPGYYGAFGNRRPFHCVICVDGSGELPRLIRKAEGSLHNELAINKLARDEKKQLRASLNSIRTFLHGTIPEFDSEEFRPIDVFAFESRGEVTLVGGGIRPSVIGRPTKVRTRSTTAGGSSGMGGADGKKSGGGGAKRDRGATPAVPFRALAIPLKQREISISITPSEDCEYGELRLVLDENVDPTCDHSVSESLCTMSDIMFDGDPLPSGSCIRDNAGRTIGIALEQLRCDTVHKITTSYVLPDGIEVGDDHIAIPRVEIAKRAKRSRS